MVYKDKRGYKREPSNLVHRHRAYHHIYLKNKNKYPLPFEAYEVHHIDGDKNNNRMDNLAVLTPEEHDVAHEEMNERAKEYQEILVKEAEDRERLKKEELKGGLSKLIKKKVIVSLIIFVVLLGTYLYLKSSFDNYRVFSFVMEWGNYLLGSIIIALIFLIVQIKKIISYYLLKKKL